MVPATTDKLENAVPWAGVLIQGPLLLPSSEPGIAPWLWNPVRNRANETDLPHWAVRVCAHKTKTEAILYKYPVNTESNWA